MLVGNVVTPQRGALLNVDIDAQVEVNDADKGSEEFDDGGRHQEVPVVEERSIALFLRQDAPFGHILPTDDGRSIDHPPPIPAPS